MAVSMPAPIARYFASENTHDTEALKDCFAADGVVYDEERTLKGLAAISAWRRETAAKYSHTAEPVRLFEQDGKTVVTARVSGSFPGSPVDLDHIFELDGDRIASLEIR